MHQERYTHLVTLSQKDTTLIQTQTDRQTDRQMKKNNLENNETERRTENRKYTQMHYNCALTAPCH